jgi:hypothetical protein
MYAVRTFKADTQPEQCCTTLFSNIHKQYPAQGLGLPHMVYSQNSGLVGLDGESMLASRKDILSPFLAWQDLAPNRSNVEFLDCSPWEHPQCLLRIHVKWLCSVFISLREDSFAAAWFDETEGFSFWSISRGLVDKGELLRLGFHDLCYHLSMLGKHFILQVAVTNIADWHCVVQHEKLLAQVFLERTYASWYELFPLDDSERKHRGLQPIVIDLL